MRSRCQGALGSLLKPGAWNLKPVLLLALLVGLALPQATVPPLSTPPASGLVPGKLVYINALGQWASVAGSGNSCALANGTTILCATIAPALAPGTVVFYNSLGQLDSVIGAATDCVHPDGSTGACGTGTTTGGNTRYVASFASVTQVVIPAATHGLGTGAVNFTCYQATGGGNYAWMLPAGFLVDASNNVTINFSTPSTGRCVLE